MATARALLRMLAAMRAPCSVKANGRVRRPPRPVFDIAICDVKRPMQPGFTAVPLYWVSAPGGATQFRGIAAAYHEALFAKRRSLWDQGIMLAGWACGAGRFS